MSRLVSAYRILAYVVGVLLAFGSLVVLPCKYLLTDGSTLQSFGETVVRIHLPFQFVDGDKQLLRHPAVELTDDPLLRRLAAVVCAKDHLEQFNNP